MAQGTLPHVGGAGGSSLLGAGVRRSVITAVEFPLGSLQRDADLAGLWILGHVRARVINNGYPSIAGLGDMKDKQR